MKVLVADDDGAVRVLLRRILVRDMNCAVTDAVDGLDALEKLERSNFALLVLDLHMPRMDGLETLALIRRSPRLATFPVVVMSGDRSEPIVRQALELGVVDYLSKPIVVDRIAERLSRALALVPAMTESDPLEATTRVRNPFEFTDRSVAMIVDGNSDVRHFFRETMATRCRVVDATSGTAAYSQAISMPPSAIFVGDDLGIMSPGDLVRKARTMPLLAGVPLVRLKTPRSKPGADDGVVYDAAIPFSFVPSEFLAAVTGLASSSSSLGRLTRAYPHLRAGLVSAAQQVSGMMLARELAEVDRLRAEQPQVVVDLQVGGPEQDAHVVFQMTCGHGVGRQLAAAMLGLEAAMVTDEEIIAAAGEVSNIIIGRLQNALAEAGISVRCGLPMTHITTHVTEPLAESLAVQIATADGEIGFSLRLSSVPE